MIKFLVGTILLLLPFLLCSFFKDKKTGFILVLFFSLIFHSLLAVFTQFFGVFCYQTIFWPTLIFDLAILALIVSKKPEIRFGLDVFVFLVVIASFLALFQVHYNYTGKFSMANDRVLEYHQAKSMRYVYPYFSDEWYAVSFIKESISSRSLPFTNPFNGEFFMNPEFFFHSFIAEICILFGLNPLTQYTLLSIFINTLIIVLAYLFLIKNNITRPSAAIAALSLLYITSSSILPGIWNLIPVTMGVLSMLLGFNFLAANNLKMASLSGLLVLFFYPPLIIFYILALFSNLFLIPEFRKRLLTFRLHIIIFLFAITALLALLMLTQARHFLAFVSSHVIYASYTNNYLPKFDFYHIIPWWTVLFAILGVFFVWKKKRWLIFLFILGAGFWLLYLFSTYRIIIGFERIVLVSSVIVTLISGFGLDGAKNFLSSKFKKAAPFINYASVAVVIIFIMSFPNYTSSKNWEKLHLVHPETDAKLIPMATANNYLTYDDLVIFNYIKRKRFLSTPWKGTVIGVATENYPASTKGGTITMELDLYDKFMRADCLRKKEIVKEKKLDYVYSHPFFCEGFEEINKSFEGFVLYKLKTDDEN